MSELAKKIAREHVIEFHSVGAFTGGVCLDICACGSPVPMGDGFKHHVAEVTEAAKGEQVATAIEAYLPPGCADHDWCDLCYSEKEYIKIARATL